MRHQFSQIVSRMWIPVLLGWVALALALGYVSPTYQSVVKEGEFEFLPKKSPSLQAEALFEEAFGNNLLSSLVVIVASRDHRPQGLIDAAERKQEYEELQAKGIENLPKQRKLSDFEFIDQVLKPRLEELSDKYLATPPVKPDANSDGEDATSSAGSRVNTFSDPIIGKLLLSHDGKATMVTVELMYDFMDDRNKPFLNAIEHLVKEDPDVQKQIAHGLELNVNGSAFVGRDMSNAAEESAKSTELLTVILVITLLLLIYRSPLLAIIPLVTVVISRQIAIDLLVLMASWGWVEAFSGLQIYITVVTYGAGVDYCMFLIARYQEHLDEGQTYEEAMANAIRNVAVPLTASAFTSIIGIGMMIFADFVKFQQAGIGISMGLFSALCASLTLTPAILRMCGSWIFWPNSRVEKISSKPGWYRPSAPMWDLLSRERLDQVWHYIGRTLVRHPVRILLTTISLMTPFAIVSIVYYDYLSYGLLDELSKDQVSVIGTDELRKHFPAGILGPATVLMKYEAPKETQNQIPEDGQLDKASDSQSESNENLDFATSDFAFSDKPGRDLVAKFTDNMKGRMKELNLADIRTLSDQFGVAYEDSSLKPEPEEADSSPLSFAMNLVRQRKINDHYVSNSDEYPGTVTRMDFIFNDDPFSRNSISELNALQKALPEAVPEELKGKVSFYILGATASIRDLKTVTDHDQILINILVILGVYVILLLVLRHQIIALFLIISVFFSYLVTLGVTFSLFWLLDPMGFAGLDWKVRMFLFTILIAIGEDYNIMLMTRIHEESEKYGPIRGISHALTKTGSIISSCGIIMAGTFLSLTSSSLAGMIQLGFALGFGVLLVAFVVRLLLVPAFLVIYEQFKDHQKNRKQPESITTT